MSFTRLVENSLNFSNRSYKFTGVPNNDDLWILKLPLEYLRDNNNITIKNISPYYLLISSNYGTNNFSKIILSFKYEKTYKPIYNTLKNVDVNFKIPNGRLYYGVKKLRLNKNEVLINPPVGQRKSSSYWSSEYKDSSLDSSWQWTVNNSYNKDGNPNNEWTEVDLLYVAKINGIITQGGPKGSGLEYIKTYIVKYSIDGNTFYDVDGGKIFNGNTDRKYKSNQSFFKIH